MRCPRVREKCGKNAGKMFSALHAEMMFAYLLRYFSRIGEHPAGSRCAAPAGEHGLAAGRHALTGGQHGLRPDGNGLRPDGNGLRPDGNGLAAGRPAGGSNALSGGSYPAIKITEGRRAG